MKKKRKISYRVWGDDMTTRFPTTMCGAMRIFFQCAKKYKNVMLSRIAWHKGERRRDIWKYKKGDTK